MTNLSHGIVAIGLVGAAAIALASLPGLTNATQPSPRDQAAVPAAQPSGLPALGDDSWAKVETRPWQATLHAYASVSDAREVRLVSPFPIRVVTSDIELGQQVSKGQQLATIEAPMLADLLDHLSNTSQQASLAHQTLEDAKARLADQLATNEQVLAARAVLQNAQAQRDQAWRRLESALITLGQQPDEQALVTMLDSGTPDQAAATLSVVLAPFSGVVMQRSAPRGVLVARGTILFAIEDVSSVYVDAGIEPGKLDAWIEGTAKATMLGQQVPLKAVSTVPRLDPSTGLMLLRYRATVPDQRQIDGAWVPVLLLGKPRQVQWVPKAAVASRDGKTWCLAADDNNQPKSVAVRVGPGREGMIPVIEGLAAGDRVLIRNAYETLYRDLNDLFTFED